eukprot:TRINITY_DN11668_c0_g1_i1.p1 TRINITY_DN11668_c0_g1~~TRINITY_DN11668_c0_g1_i1.p1  ORF type:complete len:178 (+),score=43.67 TRINITY_DN11668_c0_g1_i1:79-612(+)
MTKIMKRKIIEELNEKEEEINYQLPSEFFYSEMSPMIERILTRISWKPSEILNLRLVDSCWKERVDRTFWRMFFDKIKRVVVGFGLEGEEERAITFLDCTLNHVDHDRIQMHFLMGEMLQLGMMKALRYVQSRNNATNPIMRIPAQLKSWDDRIIEDNRHNELLKRRRIQSNLSLKC